MLELCLTKTLAPQRSRQHKSIFTLVGGKGAEYILKVDDRVSEEQTD